MKISKNNNVLKTFEKYNNVAGMITDIREFYNRHYVWINSENFEDSNGLNQLIEDLHEDVKLPKSFKAKEFSEDEKIKYNFLMLLDEYDIGMETKLDFIKVIKEFSNLRYMDNYKDNPYIKNIKIDVDLCDNFEVISYRAQLGVFQDIPYRAEKNKIYPYLEFLMGDFEVTFLLNDLNDSVASFYPCYIDTYKEYVENATGNILVINGSLGYFEYMTAIKDDVKKITIVDSREEVVDFLKEIIIPQFKKYGKKIEIINIDPNKYMENVKDGEFDYIFLDNIYDYKHLYLNFKENFRNFKNSKVEVYQEELGMLDMYNVLSDALYFGIQADGKVPSVYIGGIEKELDMYNVEPEELYSVKTVQYALRLVEYLKDEVISKGSDVDKIYSPKFLLNLFNTKDIKTHIPSMDEIRNLEY